MLLAVLLQLFKILSLETLLWQDVVRSMENLWSNKVRIYSVMYFLLILTEHVCDLFKGHDKSGTKETIVLSLMISNCILNKALFLSLIYSMYTSF